jgi:nonsense-mediated mRNA decay protein 3
LVKKSYGDKRKRHKLRNWQLQQLDREMESTNQESYERDYTEFLEELEEDKMFRQNVNIYFSESLSLSLLIMIIIVHYLISLLRL